MRDCPHGVVARFFLAWRASRWPQRRAAASRPRPKSTTARPLRERAWFSWRWYEQSERRPRSASPLPENALSASRRTRVQRSTSVYHRGAWFPSTRNRTPKFTKLSYSTSRHRWPRVRLQVRNEQNLSCASLNARTSWNYRLRLRIACAQLEEPQWNKA